MIQEKLLKFQKKGISIKKGSVNPHFKNSYADINEVLDKVVKPLNELGVVVIQRPGMVGGVAGLQTELFDTEDKTAITGFLPFVQKDNAQKLGANITYNRRYALVSMLGLEDHDDDGNTASSGKPLADDELDF